MTNCRNCRRKRFPATLECAGNSRVFLVPKVKGTQWELGAVGNAEWTGVSLGELLRQAGVKSGAIEVILEGADSGAIAEPPRPAGKIHFARSIPLGKAMDDVLLAFRMNGQPLAPAHGFPLRAIVPGWYGMAAVKWLQRVVVTDRPFNGYYQTVDYAFWKKDDDRRGPRADHGDASEGGDRPARDQRIDCRRDDLSGGGRSLDGERGDRPSGAEHRWRCFLAQGVVRQGKG